MASMRDVARKAGVGVGTVSRTLNNSGYVAEETKKKIYESMEAVSYTHLMVYGLLTSFVLIYLTDTVGLNAGIVGTLMMFSKFADGVTDVFFGTLIDKTHSKMGKARPWMLWSYLGNAVMPVSYTHLGASRRSFPAGYSHGNIHNTDRSLPSPHGEDPLPIREPHKAACRKDSHRRK